MINNDIQIWEAEISHRQDAGDGLEFTVEAFLECVGNKQINAKFERWLEEKIESEILQLIEVWLYPMQECKSPINEDALDTKVCPHCSADFREEGVEPIKQTRYRIGGENSKDIYWMIVVHGMNTRGSWQEEISWRLANKFKYSAPVLIYKYGVDHNRCFGCMAAPSADEEAW